MARTRRLRWRHLLIVLAVGVLGWLAHQIYWRVTATPAPVVDYAARLVRLAASHQPEGENGWKDLVDAASKLDDVQIQVMALALERRDDHDAGGAEYWRVLESDFDRERLENEIRGLQFLQENGVFELLARGAASPRAVRPMPAGVTPMITMALPELAQFRKLSKARVASMRVAAVEDDGEELVAALEQSLALARASAAQSFLIDRLVGYAIFAHALTELRFLLAEHRLDAPEYGALLEAMDRQIRLPPAELSLEAERTLALDAIQWCFTDDGHGDGRLQMSRFSQMSSPWGMPASGGSSLLGAMTGVFIAGRAETVEMMNAYYNGCIAESRLSPAARATSAFDPKAFVSGLSPRHFFARAMLSPMDAALLQHEICMMKVEGTRIMIAVEMHRARHGRYPESLDGLVPAILHELPPDPLHGGSYRYRPDPDGSSYLLYSTGIDQNDDTAASGALDSGGPPARFGDDVSKTGRDVLINEPRPPTEDS